MCLDVNNKYNSKDLPDNLLDLPSGPKSEILSHIDYPDLLQLRLVSKQVKGLVEETAIFENIKSSIPSSIFTGLENGANIFTNLTRFCDDFPTSFEELDHDTNSHIVQFMLSRRAYLERLSDAQLKRFFEAPQYKKLKGFVFYGMERGVIAPRPAIELFLEDRDFVLAAVTRRGYALEYASQTHQDDKGIVLAAATQDGLSLFWASPRLQNDRDVILAGVTENGWSLQFASEALKDDKELVLAAVKQNGSALQFASTRLQDDRDIVLAAVKQDSYARQYASTRLRDDAEVRPAAAVSKRKGNLFRVPYMRQQA
ncbi:MAG: hypothetical protein S4CHLAM102_06980 [Chlamydiia bacterium]|nr:hypothetical protein [Chlamydiia bacterium]